MKDKAFDALRNLVLSKTQAEHLFDAMHWGHGFNKCLPAAVAQLRPGHEAMAKVGDSVVATGKLGFASKRIPVV